MRRGLRIFIVSVAVLLLAAAVAVVAAFVYKNGGWTVVRVPVIGASLSQPLGWIEYEMHLGALLVSCFGAGALSVLALLQIPLSLRRGFERRRRERFIGALEGELSDLRNLPLTQPAPYEDIDEDGAAGEGSPSGSGRDRHGRLVSAKSVQDDDEALLMAALAADDYAGPERRAVARSGSTPLARGRR